MILWAALDDGPLTPINLGDRCLTRCTAQTETGIYCRPNLIHLRQGPLLQPMARTSRPLDVLHLQELGLVHLLQLTAESAFLT